MVYHRVLNSGVTRDRAKSPGGGQLGRKSQTLFSGFYRCWGNRQKGCLSTWEEPGDTGRCSVQGTSPTPLVEPGITTSAGLGILFFFFFTQAPLTMPVCSVALYGSLLPLG